MALEPFHQPVNATLRIAANEQMYMIGHDRYFDQLLPPSLDLLSQDNLEPFIYWRRQYLAPVLGTKHDVIPAGVDDIAGACACLSYKKSAAIDSMTSTIGAFVACGRPGFHPYT